MVTLILFEGTLTPEQKAAIELIAGESADELRRRARAVVDARFKKDGSWEELSDAILSLAELTGGGEL